jgi:hypothetical protein
LRVIAGVTNPSHQLDEHQRSERYLPTMKLAILLAVTLALPGVATANPHGPRKPAKQISGEDARSLIRNLKLAGLGTKAGKKPAKWTFVATAISCDLVDDAKLDAGVGAGDCTIDKLKVSGNAALAVTATMSALHIASDVGHGVRGVIFANYVNCTADQGADDSWTYGCSFESDL